MDYKTIIVWGAIALIFLGVIWVFRRRSKKKRMQSEGGYGTPAAGTYRYGDGPRNARPQSQNYDEPKDEIKELRQEIRDRHRDLTQLFKDFDYLLVSLQQRTQKPSTMSHAPMYQPRPPQRYDEEDGDVDRENVVFPKDENEPARKRGRPKKLNDYRR